MMSIPMEGVFMSGTHPMLLSALIVIGLGQFGLSAKADDRRSVATMQAGCGYAAYNPAPVYADQWEEAFSCIEALKIIVKNGPIQPKFMASCIPEETPMHEIAEAVNLFFLKNPQRVKERFEILATVALHQKWPCP